MLPQVVSQRSQQCVGATNIHGVAQQRATNARQARAITGRLSLHALEELQGLADAFPLTYAVDGVSRAAASAAWDGSLVKDLVIVAICVPLALGLGAATMQRRTV